MKQKINKTEIFNTHKSSLQSDRPKKPPHKDKDFKPRKTYTTH